MSALSQELNRYLTIRRTLGYNLSTEERILRNFVAFADRANAEHVTCPLFLQWKETFGRANKEKALARVAAPDLKPGRYRPDDSLLAFLESL